MNVPLVPTHVTLMRNALTMPDPIAVIVIMVIREMAIHVFQAVRFFMKKKYCYDFFGFLEEN